jgi:hypothetical protein
MRGSAGDDFRQKWWLRRIGRCSKKDVLEAFRIVGHEIRTKLKRFAPGPLTQADACQLALRIRDQRELVRQMAERRDSKHVRRLLRLNKKYREKLLEQARTAGLDVSVLVLK